MIRTLMLPCGLSKDQADALNRESGRIYSQVLVDHYRALRKHGIWLRPNDAKRLNDGYNADSPRLLHAHSIDAAQEGFYEACKTAKATRAEGSKYPHWRKPYRTTTWKKSGIRLKDDQMLLSLAKGQTPIAVSVPVAMLSAEIVQVELVYHKASRRYYWHITLDDEVVPKRIDSKVILAGDLGEIHPCALSDGSQTTIIACRELRSAQQYTNKRLAEINQRQSRCVKYSRNWWRLQQRKNRFLAKQADRIRDIQHKVSHEIVEVAVERQVGTITLGNVRDVADGKRLNRHAQQKISNWSHGQLRCYIKEKAAARGIAVIDDVNEAYTSQTCPACGHRYKPQGRTYRCANPTCGLVAHRDAVGAVNILSRYIYGKLGKIAVPSVTTYRYPVITGKRSPQGTGQVARGGLKDTLREPQRLSSAASQAARL